MSAVSSIRSRYPLGVLIVAGIALFRAASIVAEVAQFREEGILRWLASSGPLPEMPPGTDVQLVATVLLVGLFVASVLVVVGLTFAKRWAWVLAIITSGVILAVDLGWWFSGDARYASMLLNSIAVFYLNQRDVRLALRGGAAE